MTKARHASLDAAIAEILAMRGPTYTYVMRNVLAPRSAPLKTATVYRRLCALERSGRVKRVPSRPARAKGVMIEWALCVAPRSTSETSQ